jgi:hypothetical protein
LQATQLDRFTSRVNAKSKLEARNRSKIAAFAPHFPQLDKNIAAKSKFDVNKMIELAHIFFVIEMIRSDSRGRENYG